MVGLRLNHLLKAAAVAYHVFMQLCIKLIIMEESTKKIFKPKFELVQECNGLVSIHLVSTLLRLLQGTEITGTTQEDQMLVVCRTT
jgi:hypothetical protein